jgi:(p)ppGpp synthase/HD superfamily hydrolase
MSTIERAIQLAAEYHAGQVDRGGQPYILHPLWVMAGFNDNADRIVAVLHDVLEDTQLTPALLEGEGFDPDLVDDLRALTRQKGEGYGAFIERVAQRPRAAKVKLRDLSHNMQIGRLKKITKEDADRMAKYTRAYAFLICGAWS